MTEKEKCSAGLLYNANDCRLYQERLACKALCFDYNTTNPGDSASRELTIKKILGKTGEKFLIEQPFLCDYGYNIEIGENFYANHHCIILDAAKVTFGDNVFVAPQCCFYTAAHPIDKDDRRAGLEFAHPITIGSDVWIGGNCVILPGVSIGDGAVIGAGSVVTKNIPSNVVAFGNPCKVIRNI